MRINQVMVVPEYNHLDMGTHQANFCEHDIIDAYVSTLCESLENDGIHFSVESKPQAVTQNTLLIYCRSGMGGSCNGTNSSTIYYAETSKKLCEYAIESVSEWGKCYVDTAHKTKERKMPDHPLFSFPDTMAIAVDPFVPGGPRHEEYMVRLPQLGQMLAQAVFGLLLERREIRE